MSMSTLAEATLARINSSGIAAFREGMAGRVLTPDDHGYDEVRQIWNAMIDKRPALIAQCASTSDVRHAVRFARTHGLLVSIRGGGHNIAGAALCDGGLMIDLSTMKGITVDPQTKIAIAQPGLTWAEFDRQTQRHGLATTGGAVSTTGIAGLTLGGGVGWLMGRCGFAVDNLLSAEVVLHDASVVTASASSHPDLFWALRGGGGNFGIVTSFEYRLHPIGDVLAGLLLHPVERLPEMLRFYRDFVHAAPDELTAHIGIMTLPTGDRVAAFILVWSGDPADGERRIAPLRAFGPPIADMVQAMPYTSAQQMLDAAVPHGRHNYWKSGFLRELHDEAAATLVEHARRITSPYSLCLIEHIHGAPTRVPRTATAFDIRSECFHFVAIASWDATDDASQHVTWAKDLWTDMQRWAAGRAYGNILSHDEGGRVHEAYGPNYARLAEIKRTYDPDNFFRINQNIMPADHSPLFDDGEA
jgi:FAD/FMN-containing dehydrogenase